MKRADQCETEEFGEQRDLGCVLVRSLFAGFYYTLQCTYNPCLQVSYRQAKIGDRLKFWFDEQASYIVFVFFVFDSAKQKISDEKAIKRAEQEMEKIEEQTEASVNKLYILQDANFEMNVVCS